MQQQEGQDSEPAKLEALPAEHASNGVLDDVGQHQSGAAAAEPLRVVLVKAEDTYTEICPLVGLRVEVGGRFPDQSADVLGGAVPLPSG